MSRHQLQVFYIERLGRLVELYEDPGPMWTLAERRLLEHALWS